MLFGGSAVGPAAAQQAAPGAEVSPLAGAAVSMATTLLVGGGLVALAPAYTERVTDRIRDRPLVAFLYGVGLGVAFAVGFALLLLVFGPFGFVLALPAVVVLLVVAELGVLAAGRVVAGGWGWGPALLVALALAGVVGAVPLFGPAVGFVLSSLGIGTAYLDYRHG